MIWIDPLKSTILTQVLTFHSEGPCSSATPIISIQVLLFHSEL
ncbi:hypothetical protein LINPERPRIM_LOCUS21181 [Linum perenne]